MHNLMVPMLVFAAVLGLGGAYVAILHGRRKILERRLTGGGTPSVLAAPTGESSELLTGAMDGLGNLVGSSGASQRLREQLARAGFHKPDAAAIYLGTKTALLLAGAAVLPVLLLMTKTGVSTAILTAFLVAGTLYFIPNFVVSMSTRNRCQQVRMHLPEALDLLEICVSAGMGLDTSWNAVADEIREVCPILADEMALTNLEMHLGTREPRRCATWLFAPAGRTSPRWWRSWCSRSGSARASPRPCRRSPAPCGRPAASEPKSGLKRWPSSC